MSESKNMQTYEERTRIQAILEIGKRHKMDDLAGECIRDGVTVSDFQSMVLARMPQPRPINTEVYGDLGLSGREIKQYSILRAIQYLADPALSRKNAGFELEVSEALSRQLGRSPFGLFVPTEVLSKRDLVAGTPSAGGYTVQTDVYGDSFIEKLRNKTKCIQMGATVMSGLHGNVSIPRQTGVAQAYWVAENGSVTESQQTMDSVSLTPKTIGAFTDISRRLLLQSTIDAEYFVMNDLSDVVAIEIDRAAIYGSANNNQPRGITNTSGISIIDTNASFPTWLQIIDMETQISVLNADHGNLGYLVSAHTRANWKNLEVSTGSGVYAWGIGKESGSGIVNGYRAEVSNNITSGHAIFGDWSSLIIGEWGGLDINIDRSTGSTAGTVRVVVLKDIDIGVRHPESFCWAYNAP